MKFQIKFKDSRKPILLSLADAIQYKIDNPTEDCEILPEKEEKPKKKQEFILTLTDQQREDIKNGIKKIGHNEEIGFFVQFTTAQDKEFFSANILESDRMDKVRKRIKEAVIDNVSILLQDMRELHPEEEFSFEEVLKICKQVTFIKK